MSLFLEIGSEQSALSSVYLKNGLFHALRALGQRNRVLVIPPDMTRFRSGAGGLTRSAYAFYGARLRAVLPALGTHDPMTAGQIARMFGDIPFELFHAHNSPGPRIARTASL